jgi:lysophospholipid acyltransferase (LPLAT)-like uncharacterized protein
VRALLRALRAVGAVVAPTAGAVLIRAWGATLRVRLKGLDFYRTGAASEPVIYAFWHDQLLTMILALIGRKAPYTVMISRHPDGDPIARAVQRLGLDVVRASSTRGGLEGLIALAGALKERRRVIVIPDGPKGPRHVAKEGAVVLAHRTRVRIVPLALAVSPRWRAGSWDRLQLPAPFARVAILEGNAIMVPEHADAATRTRLTGRLTQELEALTVRAEQMLGLDG